MENISSRTIANLINKLKEMNYQVFETPYKLNIVGVRANSTTPNKFDDKIYVFFKNDSNNWEGYGYPATTDTGTYWLKNPMSSGGSALLKEGQYIDAYKRGLHKGQYPALVQSKPITIYRDYNRDAILDFNNGKETTGLYGINIHRASAYSPSEQVDKWSAGCQVFQSPTDFQHFINLVGKAEAKNGNSFTYTLIDERALNRKLKRYGVYIIVGVVGLSAIWTLYRSVANKSILPHFRKAS